VKKKGKKKKNKIVGWKKIIEKWKENDTRFNLYDKKI